jgi:hypothetical protein
LWAPIKYDCCPYMMGKYRQTYKHKKHTKRNLEVWHYVDSSYIKTEYSGKTPIRIVRGNMNCQNFDFRLLPSRSMR